MKQVELCARNVSAAIRETQNAINAADGIIWDSSAKEHEDKLEIALRRAAADLEVAQEMLSTMQRDMTRQRT